MTAAPQPAVVEPGQAAPQVAWTPPKLAASAALVAALAAVSKLGGAAKEVLAAARLGAGDELDAYLMAFVIPAALVNILGASLTSSFLPQYVRVKAEEGPEAAHRLYSTVALGGLGATLLAVAALGRAGGPVLKTLASGFAASKVESTVACYRILLLILAPSALTMLWVALLHAEQRFAAASLAPLATSLALIGVLWNLPSRAGAEVTLAWATVAGAGIEFGFLGWALWRRGFALLPRWGAPHPAARKVGREFACLALGSAAMGAAAVVSQSLAAGLEPGSVAALNYGNKLAALVAGVLGVAAATVLLPHFSRLAAARNWTSLGRAARQSLAWAAGIGLPLALLLAAASGPITRLVFERGEFTAHNTALVARLQAWLVVAMAPALVAVVGTRLLMALEANGSLLRIGALNLAVTVMAGWALRRRFGVIGIASSALLVQGVAAGCVLQAGRRRLLDRQGGMP